MRVHEYKSTLVFFVSRCKFKNYNSFSQVFQLKYLCIYVFNYVLTYIYKYIGIQVSKYINRYIYTFVLTY